MQGFVFEIPIQGKYSRYAHPHVVILEITGTDECLVIPAFSEDGPEVNAVIQQMQKSGLTAAQLFIALDNSRCVVYDDPYYKAHRAIWFAARWHRVEGALVRSQKRLGEMKPDALCLVAQTLLAWADGSPKNADQFSVHLLKKIRNVAAGK